MHGLPGRAVDEGKGPLPEHQAVTKTQEYVLSYAFHLVQPDSRTGGCKRVFFPGCSLSGYAPDLVVKSYRYLPDELPDKRIIFGCCGGLAHFLGQQTAFRQIITDIENDMSGLGAHEIILACLDCSRTMKEHLPRLHIKLLYEVMVERGLPMAHQRVDSGSSRSMTVAPHDTIRTCGIVSGA